MKRVRLFLALVLAMTIVRMTAAPMPVSADSHHSLLGGVLSGHDDGGNGTGGNGSGGAGHGRPGSGQPGEPPTKSDVARMPNTGSGWFSTPGGNSPLEFALLAAACVRGFNPGDAPRTR